MLPQVHAHDFSLRHRIPVHASAGGDDHRGSGIGTVDLDGLVQDPLLPVGQRTVGEQMIAVDDEIVVIILLRQFSQCPAEHHERQEQERQIEDGHTQKYQHRGEPVQFESHLCRQEEQQGGHFHQKDHGADDDGEIVSGGLLLTAAVSPQSSFHQHSRHGGEDEEQYDQTDGTEGLAAHGPQKDQQRQDRRTEIDRILIAAAVNDHRDDEHGPADDGDGNDPSDGTPQKRHNIHPFLVISLTYVFCPKTADNTREIKKMGQELRRCGMMRKNTKEP